MNTFWTKRVPYLEPKRVPCLELNLDLIEILSPVFSQTVGAV